MHVNSYISKEGKFNLCILEIEYKLFNSMTRFNLFPNLYWTILHIVLLLHQTYLLNFVPSDYLK